MYLKVESAHIFYEKANKANQHGALKASRQKRATLLMPSYLRRYV